MKQGKVVVLGCTPRAGKTTLAVRLARHGFSWVSMDTLSEAIHKGFPEVAIEDWTSQEACAPKLFSFFESLLESAVRDAAVYGLNTVVDMYAFTPEYISRLPMRRDLEVYYLAYPNTPVEEIRHNIRFYAQPTDWIAQVDEDYLDVVAQRCFLVNEKLTAQCIEYGCELIDTGSGDRRAIALDELYNRIVH